jgi:hypothetical protein
MFSGKSVRFWLVGVGLALAAMVSAGCEPSQAVEAEPVSQKQLYRPDEPIWLIDLPEAARQHDTGTPVARREQPSPGA